VDAGLVWTIVGSAAAVLGIPTAAVIGILQVRDGRKSRELHVSPHPSVEPAGNRLSAVLPPPVGRLPSQVRGRDDLVELLSQLAARPDGRVHVLAGLGGCGKSTIALKVAQLARDAGTNVWWVPAVDAASVTGQLLGLAHHLGAADGEVQEALAGRLNPSDVLWQKLEAAPRWALFFDNADDLTALASADRRARDGAGWLRPTKAGLIVVTSRIRDPNTWQPVAQIHSVEPLDEHEGAEVLMDLAPAAGKIDDAKILAARLGGLPIALHQAGSYISSIFAEEHTFSAYGRALDNRFEELLSRSEEDRTRVTNTWELSLDALSAQGRGQARVMLRVLSCFADGAPVPPMLIDPVALSSAFEFSGAQDELRALLAVGLIDSTEHEPSEGRPSVQVHPLVAETVRYRAGAALAESHAVAVKLLRVAVGGLDETDPKDWALWLTILPHMEALLRLDVKASAATLDSLTWSAVRMSTALLESGSYPALLEVTETAIQRIGGLDSSESGTLTLRNNRAYALQFLGRFAEAEVEFREVLEARRQVLGTDNPDTLDSWHNLANVFAEQGNVTEAETEWRQVFNARRRILGLHHRDTLITWHDIAWALSERGELSKAMSEYLHILNAIKQAPGLGPEHREIFHVRDHIARVLAKQGRLEEAETEFRDVFNGQLKILTPDHPERLDAWYGIASTLAEQGKYAEAETEFRQLFEIRRRVLGPDHPETLAAANGLASALANQGKSESSV
jgi:tetratricopeptide (TPR) repeat protein